MNTSGSISNHNKAKFRFKISSLVFFILILFLCFGSTIYAISDYSGLGSHVKLFRSIIITLLLFCCVTYLIYSKRLLWNPSIALFVLLIALSAVVTVVLNRPIEYLPSLFRFSSYILVANILYQLSSVITERKKLVIFENISHLFLIISILFGYFEILTDRVDYLNGDFRVAGPFRKHQLAFAMFSFVNIIIFIEFNLKRRKNILHKFFDVIIFLLAFYLFIRTGSRALIVIFFLSYFALYVFNSKSFWSIVKTFFIGILVFSILTVIVINTNISPRLKHIYTSQNTIYDPSTMGRVTIIQNSLEAFKNENVLFGIGLGGFHEFYYNLSGKWGVASHNNYLQFLIEGGIIGLLVFILYQIVTFNIFLKLIRNKPNAFAKSAFLLFVGIDILCFLQNNYYFFTQELIVWMVYGVAYSMNNKRAKNDK